MFYRESGLVLMLNGRVRLSFSQENSVPSGSCLVDPKMFFRQRLKNVALGIGGCD